MSDMVTNVGLDHLIGQQVTQVFPGDATSAYTIQMDSGLVITNKDVDNGGDPPDIVGKTLCTVIYSELDTQLQFGITTTDAVIEEVMVTLSPTLYTIGGIEGQEEEYYPQIPQELQDALPPDPSTDRVADGPEIP